MVSKLTPKLRNFFKHYCKHHSLADAAKYVGSKGKDSHSLSQIGYEMLKRLELSMPELLEAKGLGTDQLSEVLSSQLKATKPLIATWEGKITDERFYPDNAAIGKAVEHLGRMHGVFVDRHELTGKDGGDIILQVKPAGKVKSGVKVRLDDG